jgi:hypothetical protein
MFPANDLTQSLAFDIILPMNELNNTYNESAGKYPLKQVKDLHFKCQEVYPPEIDSSRARSQNQIHALYR